MQTLTLDDPPPPYVQQGHPLPIRTHCIIYTNKAWYFSKEAPENSFLTNTCQRLQNIDPKASTDIFISKILSSFSNQISEMMARKYKIKGLFPSTIIQSLKRNSHHTIEFTWGNSADPWPYWRTKTVRQRVHKLSYQTRDMTQKAKQSTL